MRRKQPDNKQRNHKTMWKNEFIVCFCVIEKKELKITESKFKWKEEC